MSCAIPSFSRRRFVTKTSLGAGLLAAWALAGCQGNDANKQSDEGQNASTSSALAIYVGTLATEDILPLWMAKEKNLFDDLPLDIEIISFQSATELIAAVTSGDVDMAMTDIMVATSIEASGTDVDIEWITLGTTPQQGRFGIMAGPNSSINSLKDLAQTPIGVGSNTILEYVMDSLLEKAGVAAKDIKVEELQKLPVRYQAMMEGQVAAAALPGTLLALGEESGCKLIADDTQGENLSQSIMISRSQFKEDADKAGLIASLKDVWDKAANMINANPEVYRDILIANANLPEAIAQSYPISEYPTCQLPSADMVNPVLEWMSAKGYLTQSINYDESTGKLARS